MQIISPSYESNYSQYGINSAVELLEAIENDTINEHVNILHHDPYSNVSCTLSAYSLKLISYKLYNGKAIVRPARRNSAIEAVEILDLENKSIRTEYCNRALRNIFYKLMFENEANVEELIISDGEQAKQFLSEHKAILVILKDVDNTSGTNYRIVVMNNDHSLQLYRAESCVITMLDVIYDRYREDFDLCEGIPPYYSEYNSRFKGAKWINEVYSQTVAVVGCGGIGSYLVYLLSRLAPRNILLYDDDKVEAGNLSGQFFRINDIGSYKVSAAMTVASSFSGYYKFVTFTQEANEETSFMNTHCLFTGLDNMTARKNVFNTAYDRNGVKIIIDGRLGFNEFQVFFVDLEDKEAVDAYEQRWLFSDEEMEETICTMKQTSFMANMIASVMVNLFINYCASLNEPEGISALPFMTSYDAITMNFKTYSPHESLTL